MEKMVNITVNDIQIEAKKSESILEAAQRYGINIPYLCFMNMCSLDVLNRPASCRVCMVEQVGGRKGGIVPACATFVSEGMQVYTNSKRAIDARRTIVELMLSDHPDDCLLCDRNLSCELQTIAHDLGVRKIRYKGEMSSYEKDTSSAAMVRDPNKCIYCKRCENMCSQVQTVGVLSGVDRGFATTVSTAFDLPLAETQCTFCGQCAAVCPTGALVGADQTNEVWNAIMDPDKYVVVQVAPAVRVALGELFGLPAGEIVTGKMVAALRRLGFNQVLDTNLTADLTIMEEGAELIDRLKNGGKLPLVTSCCPAWIKFAEHQYPDLLDNISSCKSPQEMFGALAKAYLPQKLGVDPKKMVVVSVMPCLAKKYEASREEMGGNVDYVISTRELGRMIKEACISFADLPEERFDSHMGASSGAADIFGTTGGVMEAALRTVYETLTNKKLEKLDFEALRGIGGTNIKEATVDIDGTKVKVAVAHELRNARKLMDDVRAGKSEYHAIEIMACPGGCVNGGGQPLHHGCEEIINKRREAIYREDAGKKMRRSHENLEIKMIYDEFLGKPCGDKSHDLLHTEYVKRSI